MGAIRLPNTAFKANAGTEVVSDILFLQKRDRAIDIESDWVHLGQTEDGYAINSYFLDHPEMVMGRNSSESTAHGMDYTVEPLEDSSLADQLHEAVQHIHGTYQEAELPDLGEGESIQNTLPADPDVKNFSYTLVDGEVYFRENSIMVKPDLNVYLIVNSHPGLTDLFVNAFRKEYCQQQEKDIKPSVRAKLQNQPAKNSPKISANLKGQER